MRCFRKLLGISYRDHITYEDVKARIGNTIGPYENLLTSVKRRKMKCYGHVTRSYREQFKEEDEEADRGKVGKTTSKSGVALNGISYYGKPRIMGSGGSWL